MSTNGIRTEAIRNEIASILEAQFQISVGPKVGRGDEDQNLYLDSLALLELVICMERTFDVSFTEQDLASPEPFRSVDGLVRLIARKTQMADVAHPVEERIPADEL